MAQNWLIKGSPEYNALMEQERLVAANSVNGLGLGEQSMALDWTPSMRYDALGFGGQGFDYNAAADVSGGSSGYTMTPELASFLVSGNYQPATEGAVDGRSSMGYGIADGSGEIVEGSRFVNQNGFNDRDLGTFLAMSAGLYGAGSALSGAMGAGGAATGTTGTIGAGAAPSAGIGGGASGFGAGALGADAAAGLVGGGVGSGGALATGGGFSAGAGGLSGGFGGMGATSFAGGSLGMGAAGGGGGGVGSSLGDFFSGNGSVSDYMRAGSTLAGLYTTNRAADAAQQGEANNLALLTRMYEDNKANNQPLLDLRNAQIPRINALMADPSSVTQEPGYQFGLKQGQDQINNSMAARGGYYSGQQMKASQKYGQDYAGTKLDQSLNRLMTVAGLGQQGATAQQNANTNYGSAGGQSMVNSGNNRGSGYVGYGNTLSNGLDGYMDDKRYDQWLQTRKGP